MERKKISDQVKQSVNKKTKSKEYTGNTEIMISTGSTLLDLAISGGRVRGGGIPGGILVEIFGPSGTGKTVMLSEIAGAVQRHGGETMFYDPEARLNKQFASIFDFNLSDSGYETPDTVTEVFQSVRNWEVTSKKKINGIFADSLAALSTNMEMEDEDKMGMRRAKEFSEQCRKTCRVLVKNNYLMVCSNQVRINADAGQYGQKYRTPGGEAIGFYSSLRLRTSSPEKLKEKKKIKGKEITRVKGITSTIEVYKSSVWKPYHSAPVSIVFDYGIDDIRQNLIYVKQYTGQSIYMVNDTKLSKNIEESIVMVEEEGLEKELKEQVIDLWETIESKFDVERKKKIRK